MQKTIITLAVLIIIAVGVGIYTASTSEIMPVPADNTQQQNTAKPATSTPVVATSSDKIKATSTIKAVVEVKVAVPAPAVSVREFTINGANYSFSPSSIKVKKGDTVKITFKNVGGFHDLKIDEFNIATKKISGGAEDTVTFLADKAGTFEYYCSVGDHREMGMKGTLIVE